MEKANKKSLDAKAYINAQVNEMREKFGKATDDEAKKQLIENFNELTSSDEYQENLAVVQEDTDIVREYAKRKKWWDITPEEFDAAKVDFYGKNMNLEFWEDFEKLDLWKKVDYIFEKFWDTNYAADLINELLIKNNKSITNVFRDFWIYDSKYRCKIIFNKFWRGPVSLTLIFGTHLKNAFKDEGQVFENVSENTLIHLAKLDQDFLKFGCIVNSCKDWSIGNHEILNLFIKSWRTIPFKKLSVEWQKYIIDSLISSGGYEYLRLFVDDWYSKSKVINYDINLWEDIDIVNYIFQSIIWWYVYYTDNINDHNMNEFFTIILQEFHKYYHKIIANILIQMWRTDILKYYINCFTWLTEIEKAEILWNTEVEDRLNKEKFDSDLAKLQELWEKLWLIIKVEKKKEE